MHSEPPPVTIDQHTPAAWPDAPEVQSEEADRTEPVSRPVPGQARPASGAEANAGSGPAGLDEPATQYALIDIMTAVQEAAYVWDLRSERMHWSRNAADVLGIETLNAVSNAQDFHLSIAAEHAGSRFQAISGLTFDSPDASAPYRVQYRFMPQGRRSAEAHWLEDQGRCFAGPDGLPGLAKGIIRRVDERRREEQRLKYLSDHDELTGLMNRTRLNGAVESVISEAKATGRPAVFLLVAIDNLHRINETFGFDVGDEAIRITGQRLASRLRGGDAIGRFSANKFGVLINDCEAFGMRAVVSRMQEVISSTPIETSACRLAVTISVGAIFLPRDADSPESAIGCALFALDEAKSTHDEKFVLFKKNTQLESRRNRNIQVADEVISAIREDRMRLALQPVVRTDSREIGFYECLLRMEMPDGRIEQPGYFVPLAEQLGLSRMIDQRVLELAVREVRRDPSLNVSLNVSSLTATNHGWLVELDRLTSSDRSIASRLTVEITETAAIQDLDESMNFVDALRELGCKVAIDDFGAGYTSFRNLKFLGVDMVKIDGAFVGNLLNDPDDRVFVEKLAELAAHFGMETVAEWVNDEETAAFLSSVGITYLQGFYFGEPELTDTDRESAILPGPVKIRQAV